jgi:hypothetical protein
VRRKQKLKRPYATDRHLNKLLRIKGRSAHLHSLSTGDESALSGCDAVANLNIGKHLGFGADIHL